MVSVIIVSEVRLYREGLTLALGRETGIEVLGSSTNLPETRSLISEVHPDIVLLDMLMSESVSILRTLKCQRSSTRVVALGVSNDETEILVCAENGISGLVPREASLMELISTLRYAMRGELWCSPRAASIIARRIATLSASHPRYPDETPLTAREWQIVHRIDRGLSNSDIANDLGIQVATVKNHVHSILEKLQVRSRGEAAALLRHNGLIQVPRE